MHDYLHMFICIIYFPPIKIRGEDRDAVCVSGLGSWAGSNVKSAREREVIPRYCECGDCQVWSMGAVRRKW